MEKLQAALEKARSKRGESDGSAPRERAPTAPRQTSSVEAAWAALPAMTFDPAHLISENIVTLNPGQMATPFDILRTKLLLMMKRHNWTRIGITSPTPQCGKTTVAANLALGMGRQGDLRSILFDFDMRRPAMSKVFGQRPPHDISSFLDGKVSFAEQALRLNDNTAVSMAKRSVSDPTRFLLSEDTEARLAEVESTYAPNFVLFDLPPLLLGDDTRAFLKHVDCTILVARAEHTTIAQIDACEREIADHTNVAGVVLNQVRHQVTDDSYDYDYSS